MWNNNKKDNTYNNIITNNYLAALLMQRQQVVTGNADSPLMQIVGFIAIIIMAGLLLILPISIGIIIPVLSIGCLIQRIFISRHLLHLIFSLAFGGMLLNSAIFVIFSLLNWVNWSDLLHVLSLNSLNFSFYEYQGSPQSRLLMMSISLWSLVLGANSIQYFLSHLRSNDYDIIGHGWLNIYCLIFRQQRPKGFLTAIQNIGIFGSTIHFIKNKYYTNASISVIIMAISLILMLIFAAYIRSVAEPDLAEEQQQV
jgi:hypothetical protein